MSRPSKLHLLVRLARHEESRALRHLGEVRGELTRIGLALDGLHLAVAGSYPASRDGAKLVLAAADLLAGERHRDSLRRSARNLSEERENALRLEEQARQTVTRARLRVRAIESAIERRAARQRLERERARTRRIDEAVRAARAREEELDAF